MLKSKELESLFPPKPEEPREEDCCGTGCSPCVFDIYQAQLLEWEKACRSVMDSGSRAIQDASSTTMKPVLSQLQYTPFQLVYVKPHTEDTNIYRYQAVELGDIPKGGDVRKITRCLEFKIGQHLVMKNDCDVNNESVLTRAYTPISDSLLVPGVFDVIIKLYSNGKMSNFIRNLKENAIVYWRGPYGNFSYSRNKFKHVFMFCAGTGVAPMYPIAKVIVEDEKDDTLIQFLFSCKKHTDILLREQICELAGYWNFSAHIFVSRGESGEPRYRETLVSGKISNEVVQRELAGKCVHHLLVLICGTKSFNKDMLNYVNQAGVPDENIHIF